jgi:hypothetical protein
MDPQHCFAGTAEFLRQLGTVPAGRLHLLLPGAPDEEDGAGHPGEDVGADAQVLRCPVCYEQVHFQNSEVLQTYNRTRI